MISSVSAGGERRRKDKKGGRIKELQKRVDELKVQVEKLRECVNTGKQKIRDLTDKLAKLEKLCSHCGKSIAWKFINRTITFTDYTKW